MTKTSLAALLILVASCSKPTSAGSADAANGPGDGATDTTAGTGTATDGGTATATGSGTGTGTGTTTDTTNVGDVNLITDPNFNAQLTPDKIMLKMDAAMSSVPDTGAGTVLLSPGYSLLSTLECDLPYATPHGVDLYAPEYASNYATCHLQETGGSFAARAAFADVTGYLCSVAKAGKLLLDGQTYEVDVAGDAACQTAKLVTKLNSACYGHAKVSIKAVKPAAGAWTGDIDLTVDLEQSNGSGGCVAMNVPEKRKIFVAANDTKLAFKVYLDGIQPTTTNDLAAAMSLSKDGTMRFEGRTRMMQYQMSGPTTKVLQFAYTGHTRLATKGSFSGAAETAFSAVDRIDGIFSFLSQSSGGGMTPVYAYDAHVHTLKGATADGFKTYNYFLGAQTGNICDSASGCSFLTQAKWDVPAAFCLRSENGANCGDGYQFNVKTQPSDTAFKTANAFLMMGDTDTYKTPKAWFDALDTLDPYDTVTTAD